MDFHLSHIKTLLRVYQVWEWIPIKSQSGRSSMKPQCGKPTPAISSPSQTEITHYTACYINALAWIQNPKKTVDHRLSIADRQDGAPACIWMGEGVSIFMSLLNDLMDSSGKLDTSKVFTGAKTSTGRSSSRISMLLANRMRWTVWASQPAQLLGKFGKFGCVLGWFWMLVKFWWF